MNTRSTIALAAVALALGAFIYFYERHTVGTSEIARREGRVLDVFERAKVDRIELEREGQRLVIVREDGDLPGFRLVEPLETHADEDAVEALLGALDWAVPFRTIHDVSDEDRRSFGLDDPFVRVKLSQGERAVELRIGKEAPGSDGRYAESGRAGRVYVLGADVVEAVLHDVDHFRGKRLFPEGFVKVAHVARTGEGGDVSLAVESGGVLRLEAPLAMTAHEGRYEALKKALETLEASRFLTDDEARAGLAEPPRLRIEVKADDRASVLEVFGGCPETPGKALARADGGLPVCVDEAALDALTVPADDLRELRLATARDFDVERFEVRLGDRRMVVTLGDEPRYEIFARGEKVAEGEADEGAFTDWLREMRRVRALRASPLAEGDRKKLGLDAPEGELRIVERGPLKRTMVLELGRASVASLLARRQGDDVLLEFPADARDLLEPAGHRVRSRELVDAELHQVVSIRVQKRGEAAVEVEPRANTELAGRLAALEAVRFDADRAEPRHGLESPRLIVEVEIAPVDDHGHAHGPEDADAHRRHRLLLGAATSDGVYARLDDDPMVFVVAEALVEAAERTH